ncbi:hypothetical protein B296_00041508 [Ensete ventricosum]|uniref:Secreted protein n=1 Tax=Ensete ventricosum TaxID=4639 RepID=A0A426ZII7_ENSVE|nr:hypothetical protein B296_00041508 [Ensete ventricosum]
MQWYCFLFLHFFFSAGKKKAGLNCLNVGLFDTAACPEYLFHAVISTMPSCPIRFSLLSLSLSLF